MLIESAKMRDLLNTTSSGVYEPDEAARETERSDVEKMETAESPDTYRVSLNPIPALVIILLGIMMSSHTQHSMVSTMVHAQWGNLLCGAGLARGMTYFLLYLKPPRSVLPSRPPTELLASFGLIAGGIIFMSSVSSRAEPPLRRPRTEADTRCRAAIPLPGWRTAASMPCSCTPSPWGSWAC